MIHMGTLTACMAAAPWLPSIPLAVQHGQAEIVILATFSPASATEQVIVKVPEEPVPEREPEREPVEEPVPEEPIEFAPDERPEHQPVPEPVRRKDTERDLERTTLEVAETYVPPPPPPPRKQPKVEKHPEHETPKEVAKLERASVASVPSVAIRIVMEAGALVDELPKKLAINAPPPYPADALLARIEGRVVLKVKIETDGTVAKAQVETSSGHNSLDKAALEAVKLWKFEPARRLGRAIAYEVAVPVRFSIRRG
jgi:protein TonB